MDMNFLAQMLDETETKKLTELSAVANDSKSDEDAKAFEEYLDQLHWKYEKLRSVLH